MLLKIIADCVYGHYNNGIVEPKTKNSNAFEVEDESAKRLIKLGVAKQVGGEVEEAMEADKEPPVEADDLAEEAEELQDMSINELRSLAKDKGISAAGSKKELVERLEEAMEADEEPPVLEAAEPEV